MNTAELRVTFNKKTVKHRALRPEEFLTTEELMALLKIGHKQTVYKLIKQGMPAILVGKNYRFIKHEVIQYLKVRTSPNKNKIKRNGQNKKSQIQ